MSTRQVSVSLTEKTLERVERLGRKTNKSRSQIIAEAVESFIQRREAPPRIPGFDIEPIPLEEQKKTMVESMERRAARR